ncbi:hypothetical protein QOM21_02725 [Streptomyces sp. Pv4-95]|uniref:hypothetical protein n=1 Tax=Streptomyces sp. Pv4-95 TaxID=3049543 RepID=UPI0038912550
MRWRSALVTAAWIAVGTGAGGLGAWQLASADAGSSADAHGRALDDAAVRRALAANTHSATAAEPTEPPAPTPSKTPGPQGTPTAAGSRTEAAPRTDTVRFTGGTATAECRPDGTVYLVSWSPANGYAFDEDVVRGPSAVAHLEAEPDADEAEDRSYDITCTPTGPRVQKMGDTDD